MPQRTIKPKLLSNKAFNAVSLASQAIWFRMVLVVDDEGIFNGSLRGLYDRIFKNRIKWDGDLQMVINHLKELSEHGLIVYYYHETPTNTFFQLKLIDWKVRTKSKHPKINNKQCGLGGFPVKEEEVEEPVIKEKVDTKKPVILEEQKSRDAMAWEIIMEELAEKGKINEQYYLTAKAIFPNIIDNIVVYSSRELAWIPA